MAYNSREGLERQAWSVARVHCDGLQVGNEDGFRLPTLLEALSLVDESKLAPVLPVAFAGVQSDDLIWTQTTSDPSLGTHWALRMRDGISEIAADDSSHAVICVSSYKGPANP